MPESSDRPEQGPIRALVGGDTHGTARRGRLNRVEHEVPERLGERMSVPDDAARSRLHEEIDARRFRAIPDALDQRFREFLCADERVGTCVSYAVRRQIILDERQHPSHGLLRTLDSFPPDIAELRSNETIDGRYDAEAVLERVRPRGAR